MRAAVCCNVRQCAAMLCSVLQCVVVHELEHARAHTKSSRGIQAALRKKERKVEYWIYEYRLSVEVILNGLHQLRFCKTNELPSRVEMWDVFSSSMAAGSKPQALGNNFVVRVCYKIQISKCKQYLDLGGITSWVLCAYVLQCVQCDAVCCSMLQGEILMNHQDLLFPEYLQIQCQYAMLGRVKNACFPRNFTTTHPTGCGSATVECGPTGGIWPVSPALLLLLLSLPQDPPVCVYVCVCTCEWVCVCVCVCERERVTPYFAERASERALFHTRVRMLARELESVVVWQVCLRIIYIQSCPSVFTWRTAWRRPIECL